MNESELVITPPDGSNAVGPYTVYSAGGLFTQDELATNVLIKEAVWRLSNGKFQLILPQSSEIQELHRDDLEAFIRNNDLLQVLQADMLLARFDGVELDSGTVVEYITAKFLGKPTVILRTDFRRVIFEGTSEPYNLMVKNWSRSTTIHLSSFMLWSGLFAEAREAAKDDPLQATMKAEFDTFKKSVDEIAAQVIEALEAVLEMESPYPPEYQEMVYKAARLSIGSGFDQMLKEDELDKIIQRLRKNGAL